MEKFQLFKILIDKKDENAFRSNYLQKKVYFLNDTGQIKMDFFFFWLLSICVSKLRRSSIKLRFPDMI